MKLSKKDERAARLVIDAYWTSYIKGNVEAMIPRLDDAYTQVGSAESEVFSSKKDAVKFLLDTIDEVPGKVELRNRITRIKPFGVLVFVNELCDLCVLTADAWIFYPRFRASPILQNKQSGWKIVHREVGISSTPS